MNIQDWINKQKVEAVQDRKDGKDYWKHDNLYTETDLIEFLEAFFKYNYSLLLPDDMTIAEIVNNRIKNSEDGAPRKLTLTERISIQDGAIILRDYLKNTHPN